MSLKMEQGFQEYPVLRDIIEMVEEGYVNRVPKHHFPAARSPIFDPKGSAIYVTSWADFMKMASTDVQQIFHHHHVRVAYISITERARKGPRKKCGKIAGKSHDCEC